MSRKRPIRTASDLRAMSDAAKEVALQRGLGDEVTHVNRTLGTRFRLHRGPHRVWYLSDDERPHEQPLKMGGATHVSAAMQFVCFLLDTARLPATVVMRGNPGAMPPARGERPTPAQPTRPARGASVAAPASAIEAEPAAQSPAYEPYEAPQPTYVPPAVYTPPASRPPFYDELESGK